MADDVLPLQVLELSKQVLLSSKKLADLVNHESTTEEAIIEAAKSTAGVTSQLITAISETASSLGGTNDDTAVQKQIQKLSREIRASVLDLIQATKDAISNPFDFQSSQKLQNCCGVVANYIKDVTDLLILMKRAQKVHHSSRESSSSSGSSSASEPTSPASLARYFFLIVSYEKIFIYFFQPAFLWK